MARRYSIDGRDTNTGSTTIIGLTSAATIRPKIYDLINGSYGTPGDQAVEYVLQRYTVAGTGTPVTPQPLDPADPASLASANEAHSGEPTYTANEVLLTIPRNQRQIFRWVAAPEGELVLPATAANGVGALVLAVSSAWTDAFTWHYLE